MILKVHREFNFTRAAEESDAENVLVIRDAELAKKYAESWSEHRKHLESNP
jgi:phosphatidylserine/phosphatidylglycerophosphate/cardiolipin synthase-like enzyme